MRKEFVGGAPKTRLSLAITATDTSFTVDSDGTGYPTGGTGPFVIAVGRGTANEEKILCSSRSTNTFTVASGGRGYDGTSAVSHGATEVIQHVVDAETIDEANKVANEFQRLVVDAYTAATTPDLIPVGMSITTSSTGGGWPADYVTIITVKENEHRTYQQVTDKASNKWIRTGNGTVWATDFVKAAMLNSSGALAITRSTTGNDLLLQSPNPQIQFQDTDQTGGGKNWWFHVNGGNFYILPDRGGDGSWETPYPVVINSNADITFGTNVTTNKAVVDAKRIGSTHPTARNVLNWGDGTPSLTGYLVIKTNMAGAYDMSHLHITGYSYEATQNTILDLVVAGYLRPPGYTTVNGAYTNRGRPVGLVRWAKDASGNQVLIIGSASDVWRYPQVTVDYFKYRHSSAHAAADFDNWTVGIETDISGYTETYDVPNTTPGWNLIGSIDPGGLALNSINVDFQNIPSQYTRLRIVAPWMSHNSTSSSYLYMRFNADTATNYGGHFLYHSTGTYNGTYQSAQAQGIVMYAYFYGGAGRHSFMDVQVFNQSSKVTLYDAVYGTALGANTYHYGGHTKGTWGSTAKVNRIQLWGNLAATWDAGSRIYLYGMVD